MIVIALVRLVIRIGLAIVAWREERLTPEAQAVFKALDEHRAARLGLAECPRCGVYQDPDAAECKNCRKPLAALSQA